MPTPTTQLLSQTIYAADGVTTDWNFSFSGGYLSTSHIKVKSVDSLDVVTQHAFTLIGPNQVRVTPAVPAGRVLTVYRDTPKDLPLVDFADEAGFSEIALDTNAKQAVFIAAETVDTVNTSAAAVATAAAEDAQDAAVAAAASAASAASSASSAGTSASTASTASATAVSSASTATTKASQASASAAAAAQSAIDAAVVAGFTPQAPGPIGSTTPSTGAFTTLSATNAITGTGSTGQIFVSNPTTAASVIGHFRIQRSGTTLGFIGSTAADNPSLLDNNGNPIATWSATGLAVTGALSASGDITSTTGNLYVGYAGNSRMISSGSGSASLLFGINGTEYVRLNTAGNLGLGVTPSAWYGTNWRALDIGSAGAVRGSNTGVALYSNAYVNGSLSNIYKTSTYALQYQLQADTGSHVWYTAPSGTAGNAITFTQTMTLDASGNQLLGTTAATYSAGERLTISAASTKNGIGISVSGGGKGIGIYNAQSSGATSGTMIEFKNSSSVVVGSVQATGTTTTYNTTSDHRLKENVRPANAARFMDIEFVDFEWTDGRHDCGVIAHQLASVYPDLVLGEKDATEVRTVEITPAVPAVLDDEGNEVTPAIPAVTEEQTFPVYQQVNYIGLIGRMGTTVQKQQRLIEALEARLAALESNV